MKNKDVYPSNEVLEEIKNTAFRSGADWAINYIKRKASDDYSFDYPETCPDINYYIDEAKSKVESFLSGIVGTKDAIKLSDTIYDFYRPAFEEVRTTNYHIRLYAEEQLAKFFDINKKLVDPAEWIPLNKEKPKRFEIVWFTDGKTFIELGWLNKGRLYLRAGSILIKEGMIDFIVSFSDKKPIYFSRVVPKIPSEEL